MTRRAHITRRALLAGASAGAMAAAVPALARPIFLRGGKGQPAGATSTPTLTYVNTAGTATPADVPIQAPMWFARGDVPTGSIAVPQIGGADQVYQADSRTYWDDGSLKGAVFRIARSGTIAAGGSVQLGFDIRAGSWGNASAITTADITGASDYRIEIANCHTARTSYGPGRIVTVTLDGSGGLSGGKVWHPSTYTIASLAIAEGGGSGGQLSVSSGVVSVTNPGSGYGYVGGTGAFAAAFNDIIADISTNGNRTGGRRVEQYAKGPVCDAWRASTTVAGLDHYHVTFYIERWKKADGSFLAHRACAVYGSGLVSENTAYPSYTYDLDWKDGATVIRGAGSGDTRFQTMPHCISASGATFDALGQMDWSTNNAAYNAVVQQRTLAECDYFKKTGVIVPYLPLMPTVTAPTEPAGFEYGNGNGGTTKLCTYQPFGNSGIRSPLGSGGSANQENVMQEIDGLYWMALRNGDTAAAATWRQNIRVSAAHSLSMGQLGSAIFEPTTMYVPNVIPASVQAFSGMTPTREELDLQAVSMTNVTGFAHSLIAGSTLATWQPSAGNCYHHICATYGAYLVEGEQWQLDAQFYASSTPLFSGWERRIASFGGNTYYGIRGSTNGNVRRQAWQMRAAMYAVSAMPETWADGAPNVERSYTDYTVKRQYDYLNDLVPFIGTVILGNVNLTVGEITTAKEYDFSGSGIWPEMMSTDLPGAIEGNVPFMEDYVMQQVAHGAFLLKGTASGDAMTAFRDYFKNSFVKLYNTPGSHYLSFAWRHSVLAGVPPAPPSDITWLAATGWSAANPQIGVRPSGMNLAILAKMSFASGSGTVNVTEGGARLMPDVPIADGSRIKLTTTEIDTYAQVYGTMLDPFDESVWYYWKQGIDPTVGELCTDAGLTTPVISNQDSTATATIRGFNNIITVGDTVSIALESSGIPNSPVTFSHTVLDGQATAVAIATALQSAAEASADLAAAGITVSRSSATVEFAFPVGLAHTTVTRTNGASTTMIDLGTIGMCFWLVPAGPLPADDSGAGTYDGVDGNGPYNRSAVRLGVYRMMKAMDMGDDANGNVTLAIANCATIFNAISPDAYLSGPQYAWDDTRG